MKILVTGAGGQLGRSLPAFLAAHEVKSLRHDELDIAALEQVRVAVAAFGPDVLINAAAWNRVDDAETGRDAAFRVNALGPRNLALAAAESGAAILHVSTDYVFDGELGRAYDEFDRPAPRSVYGQSKLAGEELVQQNNPRHWLVRTAWVFHEDGSNFPRTMLRLAKTAAELRVVDDQTGSPTYAPHLARGIARLIETGTFGTFHLAGAGQATWHELTCALFRQLGLDTPVIPVATAEFPRPAPRPRFSALVSRMEPRLELPPWQDGLAEFCRALA